MGQLAKHLEPMNPEAGKELLALWLEYNQGLTAGKIKQMVVIAHTRTPRRVSDQAGYDEMKSHSEDSTLFYQRPVLSRTLTASTCRCKRWNTRHAL